MFAIGGKAIWPEAMFLHLKNITNAYTKTVAEKRRHAPLAICH
jgi:hypothetical protein